MKNMQFYVKYSRLFKNTQFLAITMSRRTFDHVPKYLTPSLPID